MWNYVKGFVTATMIFVLFGLGVSAGEDNKNAKRKRETRYSRSYSDYKNHFKRERA